MQLNKEQLDTSKPFFFHLTKFIKYIFSSEVFPAVALLSVIFVFYYLPLVNLLIQLVSLMIVYKIACDALSSHANGKFFPEINVAYDVKNEVFIKVIILAFLSHVAQRVIAHNSDDPNHLMYFNLFSEFILPAIYMFLALTNSVIKSINPVSLVVLVLKIPLTYCLIVLFQLACSLTLTALDKTLVGKLPDIFAGMIILFFRFSFVILLFQILGYVIFQNRNRFNFESEHDLQETDFVQFDTQLIERAKSKILDGDFEQAQSILNEVQEKYGSNEEIEFLFTQLNKLKSEIEDGFDPVAYKIHSLILKKRIGIAANILVDNYTNLDDYIAYDLTDIFVLAQHFHHGNKDQNALTLLNIYCNKHQNHTDFVKNTFLKSQILYSLNASEEEVKQPLWDLIKNHGNHPMIKEIKSWLIGMKKIKRQP